MKNIVVVAVVVVGLASGVWASPHTTEKDRFTQETHLSWSMDPRIIKPDEYGLMLVAHRSSEFPNMVALSFVEFGDTQWRGRVAIEVLMDGKKYLNLARRADRNIDFVEGILTQTAMITISYSTLKQLVSHKTLEFRIDGSTEIKLSPKDMKELRDFASASL